MARRHEYDVSVEWTGNLGTGTDSYRTYSRSHRVHAPGKPDLAGSSDPAFRGDGQRWSPEELLVVALSQCHMLWYLHLAATAGVIVTGYDDRPHGTMVEQSDGAGRFVEVLLRPEITVTDPSMVERANRLHTDAHAMCFVARSVNFPVRHEPVVRVGEPVQPAAD
jgi:organic hydroperoxide reductase OsmC/OhrA